MALYLYRVEGRVMKERLLALRQMVRQVQAGTGMVAALAEALIEAIDLTEPTLGAWHCFDPEYLRLQARQLDARPHKGRLHGLPVGIKDVIDTHDLPTGYGSRHYEGTRPASDAGCVAMLRAEGALIVGKTVSTEFAFVAPGKTRNPYDPAHTPGGSSSGSAAAVGAGVVPVALGTQTSGSTIRPAAFCGIVGYKPSYGLIDRTGIKVLCETLDTVGLLGWRVADVALVASVLAQRPLEAQAGTAAQKLRLGVFRPVFWHEATPAALAVFERALDRFRAAGHEIVELPDPGDFGALMAAHTAIMSWEVPRALAYERLGDGAGLQPRTYENIQISPVTTAQVYDAAQAVACRERALWKEAMTGLDAVLTLPAPGEAPLGLSSTGNPVFNRGWTQLGLPCVSLPAGHGAGGMPLGVQCVGAMGADASLLAVATALETVLGAE
ncbi:amidase [Komagataeibacter xylinus]|nr:amidase [Komagataeibacter xylinus]SAY46674.1 Glutamyl-tRNA(Gln) amidotransferase subunit A [Komagataeibacter rhaeticus]